MSEWKPNERRLDQIIAGFKEDRFLDRIILKEVNSSLCIVDYTGREVIEEIKKGTKKGRDLYENYCKGYNYK